MLMNIYAKPRPEPRALPCVSTSRIRAGSEVLGVAFQLDADGVMLDSLRYTSLLEADRCLQVVAETRCMGAWLFTAPDQVEVQATEARREARFNLYVKENQLSPGQRAAIRRCRSMNELGLLE